jgi:pimeloyl-ACP methyl ester carboxylesterase
MTMLKRLATKLDTWNGPSKMVQFRDGWASETSTEIGFFKSPLAQYRYRCRGTGPTIVFAADPPMTLEVYDALIDVFSEHFRVVVFELPAMGFTAVEPNYVFDFKQTNDDVAIFLKEVAGEGAILAFSCVAGLCAIDIAARYPNLASHLILFQTGDVAAFEVWKSGRDPKGILAKPFVGQILMKQLAPKRMPDWYKLSVGRTHMIPHLCQCAAHSFQHGAMWSLASAYQTYMDPSIILPQPDQPLLAIWGLADRSHPPGNAQSPKRLAQEVTYIAYNDLGHTPELEDPVRIYADVLRFVSQREYGVIT